jgi:uncharacterized protein with HEPN domain
MVRRSSVARLTDIIEAIEHIRQETMGVTLDEFKVDWRKQWLVARGTESCDTNMNALHRTCFGRLRATTYRRWRRCAARS